MYSNKISAALFIENFFKLSENNTKISTEALAGLTTFVTMVYILAVNPQILSVTGMETGGLFTATAIICVIGTLMMALLARYPYAIAPGMGLNAFFAYVVAAQVGWQTGLFLLLIQGIMFVVLGIKLKILSMLKENTKRNPTTLHNMYENSLGALRRGMRTSITAKTTILAVMLIFKIVINNAIIFFVTPSIIILFHIFGHLPL